MPLMPVLVLDDLEQAERIASSLLAHHITVAEVTLRTAAALDIIRHLARSHPALLVGAGTVLNVDQLEDVLDAGARFVVSPGLDAAMVLHARERGVEVIPGVMTPGEVMQALALNCPLLKFFPAEAAGGITLLKALCGPFPGVAFIPTGGIRPENLGGYFDIPQVMAVGCSWMAEPALMRAGHWDVIDARLDQLSRTCCHHRTDTSCSHPSE